MKTLPQLIKQEYHLCFVDSTKCRYISELADIHVDVPLNEIGNGQLFPTEKGITLMKWIRKIFNEINNGL